MTAHDDRARDEQQEALDQIVEDARAGRYDAREIPADELAEAERTLRAHARARYPQLSAEHVVMAEYDRRGAVIDQVRALCALDPDEGDLLTVLAEYDERGRERDAARAELERLRERVAQQERITERALAANVEQRAEVERLREENQRLRQVEASARQLHMWRAEVARLRARDEAAKAVVQIWTEVRDRPNARWPVPIVGALDALARAHETEDGGQDR